MKRLLPLAYAAVPASVSAHEVAGQVGHLHPHGAAYVVVALVVTAVALRGWMKR